MPMNNFTFCYFINEHLDGTHRVQRIATEPRRETLDFIRQFARAYQCETTLDERIGGYIVN